MGEKKKLGNNATVGKNWTNRGSGKYVETGSRRECWKSERNWEGMQLK